MTMPEPGRLAAHVLLDAVTAGAAPGSDEADVAAMNLALQRLNEVGAVTATINDDSGEVTLDASNLLGGALVTLQWLVSHLAVALHVDEDEVRVMLRSFLDEQA